MREDVGGEGTLSSSSSSVVRGSHNEIQGLAKRTPTCKPDGGMTQVKTRISDAGEKFLPSCYDCCRFRHT